MIPAEVRAAVDAANHGASAEIMLRVPEVHQSNELYDVWADGQHWIAKRYLKPDEWETAPAREYASLQMLEPLDIAPKPRFYDAAVGPVVVYEYLDGRMWGRYRPTVSELDALAAVMAQLHALPTDGLWLSRGSELSPDERVRWFRRMLAGYVTWAAEHYAAGLAAAKLCEPLIDDAGVVIQALARTMPRLVFCRSDLRFANVIARPDGRLGLVDWEDAGLRDPALEIADMLLHVEQEDLLTHGDYAAFLASYCAYTDVAEAELAARIAEYCRVLPIFWLLIMLRYGVQKAVVGSLAGWQTNEMPANARIQRYLARAVAGSQWEFDATAYAEVRFFPTR